MTLRLVRRRVRFLNARTGEALSSRTIKRFTADTTLRAAHAQGTDDEGFLVVEHPPGLVKFAVDKRKPHEAIPVEVAWDVALSETVEVRLPVPGE